MQLDIFGYEQQLRFIKYKNDLKNDNTKNKRKLRSRPVSERGKHSTINDSSEHGTGY